ncbi:MAG: MerR family transcriptional regulator [Candidatus Latescibacterota bacterium]|nr:MAG: MerR family transcriptional regulator [Candidatus Latescibacterota bacterium]
MGKIHEKKYYAIGEVSKLTEVKPHILRYWEDAFPLLRPKKNRAGNRAYRAHDLKVVFLIRRLLREEHYTAEAALAKLKEDRDFVKEQLDRPLEDWIAPPSLTDRMKQDLHVLLKMIEQW